MKGSKSPTAAQSRWHDVIRAHGCVVTGGPAEIHHAAGSTAKHKKQHIGQWWVGPLCYEAHRGRHGIHGDLAIFKGCGYGETRKEIEKSIFMIMVGNYPGHVPRETISAIMNYHK